MSGSRALPDPVSAPAGARIDYAATLAPAAKLGILLAVLLCLFLAALDQTIVATALPAIVSQFHGLDLLSWVSVGYLLSSTAMVPIYGRLSDLHGRRAVLLFGTIVFLAGSALCGLSGSMLQLIVWRIVQGVGAAAITSTAFAVPADLYAPAERSRYMGWFGAAFGLASVVGPWLGGILTDKLSWRWIFYVNLPVGALALAFILARMPRMASGIVHRVDVRGTVLLMTATVALLLALSLDPHVRLLGVPLAAPLVVLGALAVIALVPLERRAASPVLPLALFRNRTFTVVTVASFFIGMATFAAVLFLSIYMVNVIGVSATAAGNALVPLMLGVVLGGLVASGVVHHTHRYKGLILGGLVVCTLGFVLSARLGEHAGNGQVVACMAVMGLGFGPAMPLLSLALQNAVSIEVVGAATATRQYFTQIGQALGAAAFGAVLALSLSGDVARALPPIVAPLPPAVRAELSPRTF
ncbi:MAG TPA: MDR family MFS transporter, partial [Candidatus Eisenbacteria bacterium]|nr:MDR family MFS transporter [Candidatus Eisenbacteria bacterium]